MATRAIDIALTKGINEAVDPRVLPVVPTVLTNLRYDRAGELVPRDPMLQENALTNRARRILDLNGSVAALIESTVTADSDLVLYRRNDTTGVWSGDDGAIGSKGGAATGAIAQGTQYVPLVSDVRRTVVYSAAGANVLSHSVAVYGDYRVHAIGLAASTIVQFYRGDQLLNQTAYAGMVAPKVFSVMVTLDEVPTPCWAVFCVATASGNLYQISGVGAVPTWSSPTLLSLGASTTASLAYPIYDATYVGENFYVALYDSAADMTWVHGTWSDGITQTVTLEAGTLLSTAVSISKDGFVAAWSSGASGHTTAAVVNAGGTALTVAATTVFSAESAEFVAIGGGWTAGSVMIYASKHASAGTPTIENGKCAVATFNTTTGAVATPNGADGGLATFWGFQIAASPVLAAGVDYLLVKTEMQPGVPGAGTGRLAVLRWDSLTIRPFPVMAGAGFIGAKQETAFAGTTLQSNRSVYVDSRLYFAGLEFTDDASAVRAVLYSAEINGNQVGVGTNDGARNRYELTGGMPVALDSSGSIENVPLVWPVIGAQKGASTGITGSVTYIAVYEVEDSQGRIGWSAPTPATTPIALTNEDITLTVAQLHVTRTPSNREPKVRIYRSTASGPYYLVTTITLTRSATGVANYTDAAADVSANAMLYSDGEEGSEVERFCPPYSAAVAAYRSRMWSASDRRVYFSQPFDSEFMPQWADIFYVEVPSRVTALAVTGDALIILGEDPDGIYYVSGDGPDKTGATGFYPAPTQLVQGIGCPTELGGANSVISVAGQLYFRSARGIETYGGGGSQVISDPIRETLATYPIVKSVTYWPERNELIWVLADATTGRRTVVYNLTVKAWTTFDFAVAETIACYNNMLIDGHRTTGIWRSDATRFADETTGGTKSGVVTTLGFRTRPFGISGFGQVYSLSGVAVSNGKTSIAFTETVDGTANTRTTAIPDASFAVGADMPLWHSLFTPRGTDYQFSIVATGQLESATWRLPPKWSALVLDVQKLPGVRRPAAKELF